MGCLRHRDPSLILVPLSTQLHIRLSEKRTQKSKGWFAASRDDQDEPFEEWIITVKTVAVTNEKGMLNSSMKSSLAQLCIQRRASWKVSPDGNWPPS